MRNKECNFRLKRSSHDFFPLFTPPTKSDGEKNCSMLGFLDKKMDARTEPCHRLPCGVSTQAQRSLSYFKLMHDNALGISPLYIKVSSYRPAMQRSKRNDVTSCFLTPHCDNVGDTFVEFGTRLFRLFSLLLLENLSHFCLRIGSAIKCLVSQNLHSLPRPLKSRKGFHANEFKLYLSISPLLKNMFIYKIRRMRHNPRN